MAEDIVAFLKGRMAEVMVERLFGHSDYHVRNFGAPWKFVTLPILRGEEKSPRRSHNGGPYDRTDEPDYVIFSLRVKFKIQRSSLRLNSAQTDGSRTKQIPQLRNTATSGRRNFRSASLLSTLIAALT